MAKSKGKKACPNAAVCKRSFSSNNALVNHMVSKDGSQFGCIKYVVYCKGCRKPFANNAHLSNHQNQSSNTSSKCFDPNQRNEAISSLSVDTLKTSSYATNPQMLHYGAEQEININIPYSEDMMTNRQVGEYDIFDSNTTFDVDDYRMLEGKDSNKSLNQTTVRKKRTMSEMEMLNNTPTSNNNLTFIPNNGKVTHGGLTYTTLPKKNSSARSITIVQRSNKAGIRHILVRSPHQCRVQELTLY